MSEDIKKHVEEITRNVLWQEAKGKLNAISATYYNDAENFESWYEAVSKLIDAVESEGAGGIG